MPVETLTLKFRSENAGGDLQLNPDPPFLTKSRVVLLIHGFNDTIKEANDAYSGFISTQETIANYSPGGNFAPDRNFIEIFWKGDDWGVASPLYYMKAIPNAAVTGTALANTLKTISRERGEIIEIMVVAHSLGTRLTLEMMKHLIGIASINISRIVFFAAATATFMMESEANSHGLRFGFDKCLSEDALSLYSESDDVLKYTFPIGQTLATGDEGFYPTALGHELWSSHLMPANLVQKRNQNAGHSDYWGWKKDKPSCENFANSQAREFLGFTGLGDRDAPKAYAIVRQTLDSRVLQDRNIESRSSTTRIT
jgi:pimeloyl-ACP methyl ester carboxylesterase